MDARSSREADPTRTARRRRGFEPDLDLSPGLYTELVWRIGPAVDPLPYLALHLTRVAGLTVDVARAGLASLSASTINVMTDTLAQITLTALPPDATVQLDGQPAGPTVTVPVGRHHHAEHSGFQDAVGRACPIPIMSPLREPAEDGLRTEPAERTYE